MLVDENGKVALDSKETIAALKYATELQKTMIPGTLSWNDAGNNQAYAAGQIGLTFNGVSIYYVLQELARPGPAGDRGGHLPPGCAVRAVEAQGAIGRADERHGVQAQQVSERGEGISALHDGGGPVWPVAFELPRLLVPSR